MLLSTNSAVMGQGIGIRGLSVFEQPTAAGFTLYFFNAGRPDSDTAVGRSARVCVIHAGADLPSVSAGKIFTTSVLPFTGLSDAQPGLRNFSLKPAARFLRPVCRFLAPVRPSSGPVMSALGPVTPMLGSGLSFLTVVTGFLAPVTTFLGSGIPLPPSGIAFPPGSFRSQNPAKREKIAARP
jgi:hypothetical protein